MLKQIKHPFCPENKETWLSLKIIIGKNGATLKKAATFAREDLEELCGKKVFLDLWVKVKENWRDSQLNIERFGFKNDD